MNEKAYDDFFEKFNDSEVEFSLVLYRQSTKSIVRLVIVHPGNDDYFCVMVDEVVAQYPGFEVSSLHPIVG